MYSRQMYAAIGSEVTVGTAVLPAVFFPFTSLDIVTQYKTNPSTSIIGNRTLNINPVKDLIEAPSGTIGIQMEPKTLGYFLKGVYGAVSTGVYLPISSATGTFTVGETLTGGTSSDTATVIAVSAELDYVLVTLGSPIPTLVAGETLTGGTSGFTATLGTYASTVFGHEFKAPQNSLPTFTVEIGYDDRAYRYGGLRFNALNSITHEDNIMTAELGVMALWEFKHATVTAITTSGAGAKTITVDQTTGLIAADTIKVFRPSTGAFLDFSAASVKTHTLGTVASETTFTVTNLETSLAVGDLIVLAPQTATYTIGKEFSWIGGSVARLANTATLALTASAASVEEFELGLENEMENRHAANGLNLVNRFPVKNHLKKLSGTGSIKLAYENNSLIERSRSATPTALHIKHTGELITSTLYNSIEWRVPNVQFQPFNPSVEEDALLDQEISFDIYRSATSGYSHKALLINDVLSY